jgi:hypothetical protein
MARQMVINYGMSDIGPWSLLDPSAQVCVVCNVTRIVCDAGCYCCCLYQTSTSSPDKLLLTHLLPLLTALHNRNATHPTNSLATS